MASSTSMAVSVRACLGTRGWCVSDVAGYGVPAGLMRPASLRRSARTSMRIRPSLFFPLPSLPQPPVIIARGVLDERGVAGGEQGGADVFVLVGLGPHGAAHHAILGGLPVAADRVRPRPAEAGGDHRGTGRADRLAAVGGVELHRLKVVLGRRPALAVEVDRVGGEVAEAAERAFGAVELDRVGVGHRALRLEVGGGSRHRPFVSCKCNCGRVAAGPSSPACSTRIRRSGWLPRSTR